MGTHRKLTVIREANTRLEKRYLGEQVKNFGIGSKGSALINPYGNHPGSFNFVVKKVNGNNKYNVSILKWDFNPTLGKVGDTGVLTLGNEKSSLTINGDTLDISLD